METNDEMEFECQSCGSMFKGTLYSIDKQYEKILFEGSLPEVCIHDSESIGYFCSKSCRDLGRDAVMRSVDVPLCPADVVPIAPCAKCGGPVDMADWHLTFNEMDVAFTGPIGTPLDVFCLAVVCKSCSKKAEATVEAEQTSSSLDSEVKCANCGTVCGADFYELSRERARNSGGSDAGMASFVDRIDVLCSRPCLEQHRRAVSQWRPWAHSDLSASPCACAVCGADVTVGATPHDAYVCYMVAPGGSSIVDAVCICSKCADQDAK